MTLLVELWPLAAAIFTAGAFIQQIRTDISTLKQDVASLKERVLHLEQDVHEVKASVKA